MKIDMTETAKPVVEVKENKAVLKNILRIYALETTFHGVKHIVISDSILRR